MFGSQGMYPQHGCKQCGKLLNADGYHPAELYAGTYTGVCCSCERSGERLLQVNPVCGANHWEFPPHCPSWRRARERFTGYNGCEVCKGRGRLWVGRPDAQGGSYTKQCEICSARFIAHPLRVWESNRLATIRRAAENLYRAELKRLKLLGKAKKGEIPKEQVQAISGPILARMDATRIRFQATADKRLRRV